MKNSGIKYKGKRRLKFRHIYGLILFGLTVYFAWSVIDLLVLTPSRNTGIVALGARMENIDPLEDSWMNATENFGATLTDVDYVSLFWNTGPVVFVNVRFEPGISRSDARQIARDVVEYFIEVSNEVARQYDIQIVISYGDISYIDDEGNRAGILVDNQNAVVQHVHEYNFNFAEATLAWAENYPSNTNVTRASGNINSRFTNSIREIVGEEGLERMRARLAAIDVVIEPARGEEEDDEDEDFERMPEYPRSAQIEQSNISDFPNWGTWCNDSSRIIWTP